MYIGNLLIIIVFGHLTSIGLSSSEMECHVRQNCILHGLPEIIIIISSWRQGGTTENNVKYESEFLECSYCWTIYNQGSLEKFLRSSFFQFSHIYNANHQFLIENLLLFVQSPWLDSPYHAGIHYIKCMDMDIFIRIKPICIMTKIFVIRIVNK